MKKKNSEIRARSARTEIIFAIFGAARTVIHSLSNKELLNVFVLFVQSMIVKNQRAAILEAHTMSLITRFFTVDYVKTDFYRSKLVATVVSKAVENIQCAVCRQCVQVFCVPFARACSMCVFRLDVVYESSLVHVFFRPSVHQCFLCFPSVFCIRKKLPRRKYLDIYSPRYHRYPVLTLTWRI